MNLSYGFPLLNGGENKGINDPGIENFIGETIKFLTREVIQNALDARDTNLNKPVKIKFKLHNISQDQFPDIEEFRDILKRCLKFYEKNEETCNILNRALNLLDSNDIPILEISDYNTTGLIGAKDYDNLDTNFNSLVKSSGSSPKDGESGGSYGIGKSAAFAASLLRFVIYSTLTTDNTLAIQGVARLCTHRNVDNKKTQGTGYLGITSKDINDDVEFNPAIDTETNLFDDIFIRREVGPSLYIMGFVSQDNWVKYVIISIIESYMIAIVREKLEIEIYENENVININKHEINNLINLYVKEDSKKNKLILNYYKAISTTNSNSNIRVETIVDSFVDSKNVSLGKLKLHLLLGKDLPNTVCYIRSTGMKIIDKKIKGISYPFIGVLEFEGEELNKFIRKLETPRHDKLEFDRHPNPSYAKKTCKNITKWIKSKVEELCPTNLDKKNVNFLSKYLPKEINNIDEPSEEEGFEKLITNISIRQIEPSLKPKSRRIYLKNTENQGSGGRGSGGRGSGGQGSGGQGSGGQGSGGRGSGGQGTDSSISSIDIKESRVFKPNCSKAYRATIVSNNKCNTYLNFVTISYDGSSIECENANIESIIDLDTNKPISVIQKGIVGPIKFSKNEQKNFELEISTSTRCSIDVYSVE